MPIVSVTFAITLYRINEYKKNLGLLLLIIGLGLNLYFLDDKTQNSEVNLSYRNQIKANISLFEYLNDAEFSNKKVKMDFPISLATKDPRFGYSVPINYDVVNFNEVKQVDYFVYTLPGNWSDKIIPQDSLILIHIIKVNAAKSLIFRKK